MVAMEIVTHKAFTSDARSRWLLIRDLRGAAFAVGVTVAAARRIPYRP